MERFVRGDAAGRVTMLQQPLVWSVLGTLLACSLFCFVASWRRSVMLRAALEAYRRSEERYQLIADNCSDVIWVCTLPSLQFAYVSPAIRRQRGFTPEELIGMPLATVASSDVEHQVRAAVARGAARFAGGDASARFVRMEVEVPRKDGSRIAVETPARSSREWTRRCTGPRGRGRTPCGWR